jgi:glycine cleavage system aminomethyltransferase T
VYRDGDADFLVVANASNVDAVRRPPQAASSAQGAPGAGRPSTRTSSTSPTSWALVAVQGPTAARSSTGWSTPT